MSRIHELIAAEADRKDVASKLTAEAIHTFSKKPDHFMGQIRTVTMYDETRQSENLSDHKEIVDSVTSKLAWVWGALTPALDTFAAKENSNTSEHAIGDVIVDDEVILESVPAIVLLGLERRLGKIYELYQSIPTLDPGIAWVDQDHALPGVYRTEHPQQAQRTEKTLGHKVLYDATDKHPAQIETFTIDTPVGKIETNRLSGMVPSAVKAHWLARITKLQIAVKEARQRANMAEVRPLDVGERIQNFIHSG